MKTLIACAALISFGTASYGSTFVFDTDPFAGANALTTPGRQIVGGEPSIAFDIATDVFAFERSVFSAVGKQLHVINDTIGNIPATGVNTVVLETFDNDNDPTTPFNAGIAANLIAAQLTDPQPGFFIYFNSALDLPRLVYSTDLSDNTADLKVLARLTNLGGQTGRDALAGFSATNFKLVPETPATGTLLFMALGALFLTPAKLRYRRA